MNVYFHTFGCKANQYDTDQVRQAFADQGAVVVDDPAQADLAVVNSCTVTHHSEAKLRGLVRRMVRERPRLETVVMGCAAALDNGTIAALPSVRAVVGGDDPEAVLRASGLTTLTPSPLSPKWRGGQGERYPLWQGGTHGKSRGLLKIQDGCDEHCTFCATTLARGANRSRSIDELVLEAQQLADHHEEIVLTGVHIGTYGQDRTTHARPERSEGTLGHLLEALVRDVPQVRFRLSSIEATEVDDQIADLLIGAPRQVAAHLHAPLQSGSDRVLKRMGRHWYTAASYRARLEWLAARLPVFGLGADIIAGFPGESATDHAATVALVRDLPFTYLHVFPFSVRPDAPAARLPDAVPAARVRDRAAELRSLGESKAQAYRARRRGAVADGVVSGRQGGAVEFLTEDYLSVYLPTEPWDMQSRRPVTID